MKKMLKSILAAGLIFIMAMGSITAFAAEERKCLWWDFYSEGVYEDYQYAGEFKDGVLNIKTDDSYDFNYFVFDADKAGYYVFDYTEGAFDGLYTPEYLKNGKAYDIDWAVFPDDESDSTEACLLYMNEGENYLGTSYTSADKNVKATAEYYGEKINSIDFEENAFNVLLNEDVSNNENGNWQYVQLDGTVNFSSGKKIELDDYYFYFTTEKALTKGENVVTLEFFRYTENINMTVCEITDFIKDIEMANYDKYLDVTTSYNGYSGMAVTNEPITVTYTDGSKEEFMIEDPVMQQITLPNGMTCTIYAGVMSNENGDPSFKIMAAGHAFKDYECRVEKDSFESNLSSLGYYVGSEFRYLGGRLNGAVNGLKNSSSAYDFIFSLCNLIRVVFDASFDTVRDVYKNLSDFAEFYA